MNTNAEKLEAAIEVLVQQITDQEKSVIGSKQMVNDLCQKAGLSLRYPGLQTEASSGSMHIRSDQFHGRPRATVIKEYLEMRKGANLGAATLNEIYDSLVTGGHVFETRDEEMAKQSLRMTLRKNIIFYRISSTGAFGLAAWYEKKEAPKGRPKKRRPKIIVKIVPEPKALGEGK